MYDPRKEARRQLLRLQVPDDVDPRSLDQDVRADLRSLAKDTADLTAKHLVMAGRLLDDDPQTALGHARAAGALAGRIGPVREAVGLAAYAAHEWAEALSELRASRRITGRAEHLAVIADCERALGRPERALAVLDDPEVPKLEQSARVELVIVVAGARRDLGQPDAGVLLLQGPARATTARRPWATRLWYAYADMLLAADRADEAREWFAKAAEQDGQGETDAMDRLLELDGVVLQDLQAGDDDDDEQEPEAVDLDALVGDLLATPASPPDAHEVAPDAAGSHARVDTDTTDATDTDPTDSDPTDSDPTDTDPTDTDAETALEVASGAGDGPVEGAEAGGSGVEPARGAPKRYGAALFSDEVKDEPAAAVTAPLVPVVPFSPPPSQDSDDQT